MAWFPGAQRYYNEVPSPRIPFALSANIQSNTLPESEIHTGFLSFSGNASTLSLNARPHFENTAKRGLNYSRMVEDAQSAAPPVKKRTK